VDRAMAILSGYSTTPVGAHVAKAKRATPRLLLFHVNAT